MNFEMILLSTSAATIAFVHTLSGPDHYLPFAAMAKARDWSVAKAVRVTLLCGMGHITGSILLGFVGVFMSIKLGALEWIEGVRGELAVWALIAFGFVYLVWGLRDAYKNKSHRHRPSHDGLQHRHAHRDRCIHVYTGQAAAGERSGSVAPWMLLVIFVLGPCELLIPLYMYPAAKQSVFNLLLVTGVFGAVTVLTMLIAVVVSIWGLNFIKLPSIERFGHALAGTAILTCGLSVIVLGL